MTKEQKNQLENACELLAQAREKICGIISSIYAERGKAQFNHNNFKIKLCDRDLDSLNDYVDSINVTLDNAVTDFNIFN